MRTCARECQSVVPGIDQVNALTIVNYDGAVGMGVALLISIGLRRLVTLEGPFLDTMELRRRLLGSLFSRIDGDPRGQEVIYGGNRHSGQRGSGRKPGAIEVGETGSIVERGSLHGTPERKGGARMNI